LIDRLIDPGFCGAKDGIRRVDMANVKQNSTRFKDEIRIISPWAFFIASVIIVVGIVAGLVAGVKETNPADVAVRSLLGMIAGAVVGALIGCYIMLIGYINRDAGRRGMSRVGWTLIAIFVPNGLGIVLYFVLRKPRAANCPQCDAVVQPGFSFCPRCRNRLQPVCPRCQRSVDLHDKFCPYCGGTLESAAAISP
jgi:RNA polymerase subunit RPABC4/transcription elongation factor Spt4